MNDTPKIFIGLPTMGKINVNLASQLLYWVKYHKLMVHASVCVTPVDHARNEIVRVFLKSDCTHLLFIDADTVPPPATIERLLACKKPVASALTSIYRRDSFAYNCFTHVEEMPDGSKQMHCVEKDTGIVPIESCGASCMLIERSVFLKVKNPWFLNTWNADHTSYVSEDISFCKKVKDAGLDIVADTALVCGHVKELTI